MRADFVFRGGRVHNWSGQLATALAVKGERIVAVGADDDVDAVAGRGTTVVELNDRLVTPGFIDAHAHPGTSGLDRLRVPLHEASNAIQAVEVVSRYATANSSLPWVIGSGWSQSWFERGCPPKDLLDRAVTDRPALLWNRDGHGAWVNTVALRLAGIDETTPDPPDGRIERGRDGAPQGTLHEGAVLLVERFVPPDTAADFEQGLLRGQSELLSYGVTGWQDANVSPDLHEAYLRLAADHRLKARVVGALWWDRKHGLDQIDELVERREASASRFAPRSVKLMLDGVAENFTASMLEPWLDDDGAPTENRGVDFIDHGLLHEIVTRLDAAGFQCHFHAIGDRAVRAALDAVESAIRSNGASGNRHHIAHIQVVHPDDIGRFAALRVVANCQPVWAYHDIYQDELTIPYLGQVRAAWQYPFGALAGSGAVLAMGSDWAVSTANVMEEMEVAATRSNGVSEPFYPEQSLTRTQALHAFTRGSAFVNHAEADTGDLAVGMLADLVVLDRDPLEEGSFRGTRVDLTMVGGEVVHEVS